MTVTEQLCEEARQLPEPLAREVLDFVRHLRRREDRAEWRDLMQAQQSALVALWDNAEDEAWDNV